MVWSQIDRNFCADVHHTRFWKASLWKSTIRSTTASPSFRDKSSLWAEPCNQRLSLGKAVVLGPAQLCIKADRGRFPCNIHVQDILESEANFSEVDPLYLMASHIESETSEVFKIVTDLIKCTKNSFRHAPNRKRKWREFLSENEGISKNPSQYANTRWNSWFEPANFCSFCGPFVKELSSQDDGNDLAPLMSVTNFFASLACNHS